MTSLHPVHLQQLPPSAKNCQGCSRLQWEGGQGLGARRRVCMVCDPPRIPGNLSSCPIVSRSQEAI